MQLWQGKRYVLLTALILDILSFVCLVVAFSTPYWYISWPRVYSGFRKIGLWEACFSGLTLPRDPTQKSYHGCWWILAPELWNIRHWVMPRTYRCCSLLFRGGRVGLKIEIYEIHEIHQNLRNPVSINRPIVSGTCY